MSTDTLMWQHINYYLQAGISVVPVRLQAEMFNGRVFGAKTPIGRWKQYQEAIIHPQVLWEMMEKHPGCGFAVICGKVSGSLEIIDIDEKHNPGGSALYLSEIKLLYPDLFSRLRIHRTGSGGHHILYRCEELLTDGNQKLAVAEGQKEAWLETRGEGGYAVAPPAPGYTIVNNVAIPVISKAERDSLLNIARLFDTRAHKRTESYRPPKRDTGFYDEDPWTHFNNSPEAELLLTQFGWEVYQDSKQFIQFTRPGKQNGISASFIKDKRIFYVFTTSTEFEGSRGYQPATVLAILKHKGDKKATYHDLVQAGYGRVNPKRERQIARAAAAKGAELPANFSTEAKKQYETEAQRLHQTYPFGIFWSGDALAGYKISREGVYQVAGALGFALCDTQICYVDGYVVHKVDERNFFDRMKAYIREDDEQTQQDVCDAFEAFLQRSGKFTITRLPLINPMRFLESQKLVSYKFYRNCWLAIHADRLEVHSYDKIGDRLVWADQIQQRDFVQRNWKGCLYDQFLDKAVISPEHAHKVIGYLAHEYKDEEMGYIITLTEVVPDPKMGGGSGKNVFGTLLRGTTTHVDVAGSQVQLNEKFLQAWNGERVMSISDVRKNFEFEFLKNLATNGGQIKKLFKDERTIGPRDVPKFIVSTNFSYEVSDGGLRRRIIPVEFTDFFTRCGGVKEHFGVMFPYDWTEEQWAGYDNMIVHCIQQYLRNPKLTAPELTETGWLKQFDMNYGQNTRLFIEEHFENWRQKIKVPIEDFNSQYRTFCNENGITEKYRVSAIRMNQALAEWCKKKKVGFVGNFNMRVNGVQVKMKMFGDEPPF